MDDKQEEIVKNMRVLSEDLYNLSFILEDYVKNENGDSEDYLKLVENMGDIKDKLSKEMSKLRRSLWKV